MWWWVRQNWGQKDYQLSGKSLAVLPVEMMSKRTKGRGSAHREEGLTSSHGLILATALDTSSPPRIRFCSSPHTVHSFSLDSTLKFKLMFWQFARAPLGALERSGPQEPPLCLPHSLSCSSRGPVREAQDKKLLCRDSSTDPGWKLELWYWGQLWHVVPQGIPGGCLLAKFCYFCCCCCWFLSVRVVCSPCRCLRLGFHVFQFQALLSGETIQLGFISKAELYPWVNHSNTFLSLCQRAAAFESQDFPP